MPNVPMLIVWWPTHASLSHWQNNILWVISYSSSYPQKCSLHKDTGTSSQPGFHIASLKMPLLSQLFLSASPRGLTNFTSIPWCLTLYLYMIRPAIHVMHALLSLPESLPQKDLKPPTCFLKQPHRWFQVKVTTCLQAHSLQTWNVYKWRWGRKIIQGCFDIIHCIKSTWCMASNAVLISPPPVCLCFFLFLAHRSPFASSFLSSPLLWHRRWENNSSSLSSCATSFTQVA